MKPLAEVGKESNNFSLEYLVQSLLLEYITAYAFYLNPNCIHRGVYVSPIILNKAVSSPF